MSTEQNLMLIENEMSSFVDSLSQKRNEYNLSEYKNAISTKNQQLFSLFKNLMKRELQKEDLAKLYREFSRQKYNKYKHQFPRMRESELVSKIIKEWEVLSSQQKEILHNTYISEKHISDENSESSDKKQSPGSSIDKKKKSQRKSVSKGPDNSTETHERKSGVRVFVSQSSQKKEKQLSESSDFARDAVKKDFQISESDQNELGLTVSKTSKKKKKITKQNQSQPRTEYLKFFKFYYDKITVEHPRWTSNQISTIIKLLWKKKSVTNKKLRKTSMRTPADRKKMSGRLAFRKAYRYSGIEGAERWKQLPFQSKKYWKIKGEGLSIEKKVVPSNINFPKRKASQSSINTVLTGKNLNLNFMKKIIS